MYEIFEKLIREMGITPYRVAKDTGVTTATLTSWKKGVYQPKPDKLQKIADYLGVSIVYLMTGKEDASTKETSLSARDERDIAKDLESIMSKLSNKENGPTCFDGKELSEESQELFKDALEVALRNLKVINKEKYNPNKKK